ncbi:9357_t:CDS:2 [Entrophospora sp. SA101]|nr:9357_t:CDS:2 [Entrophospora sp. SA101]CAJ0824854.1 20091_t:CDS:2 [Entrophospora sp. SA101]
MLEILLCKRPRKSEPVSVVLFRKFIVILFVLIVLTVLVILSIGVNRDTPTITRKYLKMENFPVPVVTIKNSFQYSMGCRYFFNKSTINGTSCIEYVKQPTHNDSSNQWGGSFSSDTLSFIDASSMTKNQRDIAILELSFKITDLKYNITNNGSIIFDVFMHDQEYDPYDDILASGTDDYSIFAKSLQESVNYNTGNIYTLRILRKQRTILKDSPLNDLGLSQKYPSQTYVVTNDRTIGTAPDVSSTIFRIYPQDFLLETETGQRNKNALSVISNVLAVWGGLTAFYIFLFGADSIKPWGFIQARILINETRNKLMSAPFSKKEGTPEERIEALETFLKDHVIDVGLIDQLNKSPYKSHEDDEK